MIEKLLIDSGLRNGGVAVYGFLGMVFVALIKVWPVLTRLANEARDQQRANDRQTATDCQTRIDAMERRVDATDAKAHKLEMKFTLSLAAYRIVVAELHRINPKSAAIEQAQALLSPDMMAQLPEIEPRIEPERTEA